MTNEQKELLQARHRLEEAQARNRVKERKARTRRLIERGAILESIIPQSAQMSNEDLKEYLTDKLRQ